MRMIERLGLKNAQIMLRMEKMFGIERVTA